MRARAASSQRIDTWADALEARRAWNESILVVDLLIVLVAVEVDAGEYDVAWANLAGERMGRAEDGANCPGYRLNSGRRDQILALYKDKRLERALEHERVR